MAPSASFRPQIRFYNDVEPLPAPKFLCQARVLEIVPRRSSGHLRQGGPLRAAAQVERTAEGVERPFATVSEIE
jgi:hypothetical protein